MLRIFLLFCTLAFFPGGGGTIILCRFNNNLFTVKNMDIQTLSEQELKNLVEKIKNSTATQDEEILFLDILNAGVESLTEVIKKIPQ